MLFKLIHIVLAFLVYLSSIGLAINSHYCKGELIDSKIYLPAEKCENYALQLILLEASIADLPPCCQNALKESHRGCCEDTSEFKKLEIDYLIAQDWADMELFNSSIIPFPISIKDSLYRALRWSIGVLPDYRPPPLSFNYQVLFQVFRI